jgi:hypothetical protein
MLLQSNPAIGSGEGEKVYNNLFSATSSAG